MRLSLYGFSQTVRETRTSGVFHTSKTIDGLNLKKPFRVFSYSPRDETFMGFPYEWTIYGLNLKKTPSCVLLFYIGGSRHLLINLYRNLSGSYATWWNCINTSYILAIKVVRFWSKNTIFEWHNREAVSFFLNKFSTATHLWYKIIPCMYIRIMFIYKWLRMFTVNKSLLCGKTCSDLTQPCIKGFFHSM